MGTYKTSDFRKGLKVQIDGEPYLMVEMNFVKPGKGNALYKCRMKNLVRGSILDRTYKGGDELESAEWKKSIASSCTVKANRMYSWTTSRSNNTN